MTCQDKVSYDSTLPCINNHGIVMMKNMDNNKNTTDIHYNEWSYNCYKKHRRMIILNDNIEWEYSKTDFNVIIFLCLFP